MLYHAGVQGPGSREPSTINYSTRKPSLTRPTRPNNVGRYSGQLGVSGPRPDRISQSRPERAPPQAHACSGVRSFMAAAAGDDLK
jgi:hypothetical protein